MATVVHVYMWPLSFNAGLLGPVLYYTFSTDAYQEYRIVLIECLDKMTDQLYTVFDYHTHIRTQMAYSRDGSHRPERPH